MRSRVACGAAIAASLLFSSPCLADETQYELWPEANAYFKLSSQVRLYALFAGLYAPRSWTDDETTSVGEMEIGAHLDVSLKPIFRRTLRKGIWERERYLPIL